MKLVLDANVLIAAFAARGLCESLFELCLEKHELVASAPLLVEVREKLATKLKLPEDRVDEVVEFLDRHSSNVQPAEVPAGACRDPDDLMVLGTAKAGDVRYLVTGDRDLLILESYEGISVVTPRQFWEAQAKEKSE